MSITVRYSAVDGFRQTRKFKTVSGARRYAEKWVGASPDMGNFYAVSSDGVGTISVSGIRVGQLFGIERIFPEALERIGVSA
jgi:hypothetical protein